MYIRPCSPLYMTKGVKRNRSHLKHDYVGGFVYRQRAAYDPKSRKEHAASSLRVRGLICYVCISTFTPTSRSRMVMASQVRM